MTCKMIKFLVDNIYVRFGGHLFRMGKSTGQINNTGHVNGTLVANRCNRQVLWIE